VLDDGWFGTKYPRNNDHAGLGDWQVNTEKLKGGLDALVKKITALDGPKNKLKFGLWVEPEHCNPKSEVFEAHPEWTLHAKGVNGQVYPRVQQRNQYILDLSQTAVQDHLIKVISDLLASTEIAYIKWDHNKGAEQFPTPAASHGYILGLYRVLDTLTKQFPDVLWEGCASGGSRFDAGMLQYFPGSWTSDNTDPVDRLHIQTGTSMVYPPSSMSGHVSASPNHQTGRSTPFLFRAHVAMLCGSFGFELNPISLSDEDRKIIPSLVKLSEKISPFIIQGDLYRLARPDETNWPAFMYLNQDGSEGVILLYQVHNRVHTSTPPVRVQGLDSSASYTIEGEDVPKQTYRGNSLGNAGIRLPWTGDFQSRILFLKRD
jgi:alpha-galactosidase